MIECQRHLFDIPEEVSYFNCGYMSPLLKASTEAGQKALLRKSNPWELTPKDFFTDSDRFRELAAELINSAPQDIAIIPSASYGLAIAAANIPLTRGDEILVLEDQFPSNIYCWQRAAKESGATIITVARPEDRNWTQAVQKHITPRTAVAALPHNHWADGGLINLIQVRQQLDQSDAKLVLDVTQSLGAMPLDVQKVRPDFMAVAAYKWLLGPYSVGFMYAAPDFQNGIPLEENWLNRAGSEDFAGLVNYQEDYQPGAVRYDMGERANFAQLPIMIAALEQLLDWGTDNIQATLRARNQALANELIDIDLTSVPTEYRAGHFLGLEKEGGFPADILSRLADEKIFLSQRGDSLRITPHLFNSDQDFDRLISSLKQHLK
ncbi:aminotransferase class V-fold PLP-dependent enzyme [Sneathiella sp. P13V-1]|uniref:aminotransferase class V-fold PLP-dependent enzyme n=1 Tax=Sneathiella sp. P13V-1 TaxID=2697366 RepID=UPI00187B6C18|nr:aminotransferase class V-fold PLP-dependent enzyme [Sneathiella sp. P13V-1]MBE7637957.1 aminotransferase class V-fold PLP-dependent enzyme [Sneathiella sp. P13V-1]